MLKKQKNIYTVEEYLELEEKSESKNQFYKGEIFGMSGGSFNHNIISGNFFVELKTAFRGKKCNVFNSDMKVQVKANGLFTYPDLSAVCGEIEFTSQKKNAITNPTLIVEVLSKSTSDYDRGSKFTLYREVPELENYILIDQFSAHIEYFYKNENGFWVLEEFRKLSDTLKIHSLNLEIPLSEIYEEVVWED